MSFTHKKKKKGQSTIEYLILVTGIIVVIVFLLKPGGPFSKAYNDTLQAGTNGMLNMALRLQGSRPFIVREKQ